MFESLREELAECTQRCHVDSHAGEKRWSTTALQDASRRDGENCPTARAFEMCRGWDASEQRECGVRLCVRAQSLSR